MHYGDTDVFRRLTYWDPDTGYTTSCGSKKIGVLAGDSKKRDLKKLIPIAEYEKRQRKKPSEGIDNVLDLSRLEFRQEANLHSESEQKPRGIRPFKPLGLFSDARDMGNRLLKASKTFTEDTIPPFPLKCGH